MVDMALPKSDRMDLDDDDTVQAEVELTLDRLRHAELIDSENSKPKKKQLTGVVVTLDYEDWSLLTKEFINVPPLVNVVVSAIRGYLNGKRGMISIRGSAEGWNALVNYSLNKGIGLKICGEITAQVGKGT